MCVCILFAVSQFYNAPTIYEASGSTKMVRLSNQIRTNVNNQNIIIENSNFESNTAIGRLFDENSGGAISVVKSQIIIKESKFNKNVAIYGGSLIGFDSNMTIDKCSFTFSSSVEDVGALWSMGSTVDETKTLLNVTNSNFTDNTSGRYYGALASNLTNPYIFNCIFSRNTAKEAVGAIGIVSYYWAMLKKVKIIDNKCGGLFLGMEAPALYLEGMTDIKIAKIFLDRVFFSKNKRDGSTINRAISSYGKINIFYEDYACFDGTHNEMIERVNNFAPGEYYIENIFERIDSYETCKAKNPTQTFTPSNHFTKSSIFTKSLTFTHSNIFTASKNFPSKIPQPPTTTAAPTNVPSASISSESSSESSSGSPSASTSDAPSTTPSEETTETMFPPTSSTENGKTNEEEEEEEVDDQESKMNMPALAAGAGSLLFIIIIVVVVVLICCLKKKNGGGAAAACCCGACRKKVEITNEANSMFIMQNEHDERFADYINPEYALKNEY